MRKSQLYGQIFIYVLTVILISFIFVYGYRSINAFQQRAEKVSCLKFRNDLKGAVDVIQADYGSVKKLQLQTCSGYTRVCFVESTYTRQITGDIDPIIEDSIRSGTGKNVFLIDKTAKDSFDVGKISVNNRGIYCLPAVNNQIEVTLEGKGDHVDLR